MEAAQTSFISSTFWTERIGPSAALKTLEVMEKVKSWKTITSKGLKMQKGWRNLANTHKLSISISGLPSISSYSFNSKDAQAYKTFITQEMLKKGFLASTNFYACTEHKNKYIEDYFDALDSIYSTISKCEFGDKNMVASIRFSEKYFWMTISEVNAKSTQSLFNLKTSFFPQWDSAKSIPNFKSMRIKAKDIKNLLEKEYNGTSENTNEIKGFVKKLVESEKFLQKDLTTE